MAQGTGIDVREAGAARRAKAKQQALAAAAPRQEPDLDTETMKYQERPNPRQAANMAPAKAATKSTGGTSFGQAFAAARKELGAGKTFDWNGKKYTTNYAEEVGEQGDSDDRAFPGKDEPIPTAPAPVASSGNWAADIDQNIMPWLLGALGIGGGAAAAAAYANRPPRVPTQGNPASQGIHPYAGRTPIQPDVPDFRSKFTELPDEAIPVPPINEPQDPNANWFDKQLNGMVEPEQRMAPGDIGMADPNEVLARQGQSKNPMTRKIVNLAKKGDPEALKYLEGAAANPELRQAVKALLGAL